MAFCLPVNQSKAFLAALRDGRITPEKMTAMTSAERRSFFEGIVGKENAKDVNALLESKLLLKDQQRGLISWAKTVSGISAKEKSDLVTKVSKLDNVLDPNDKEKFLSDLAEKKLKVGVSADEMQHILELSKIAEALKSSAPKMSGVSDDYLQARENLRDYIASRKPESAWKSILSNLLTIGRNNLLMNPSTPIKATEGQLINLLMDKASRRIGSLSAKSLNPELASKANAEAWETFRKTGLNTASMENLDDTGMLGEKNRFNVPSGKDSSGRIVNAIESGTRKVAKISNKIAIDWEHNLSFVKFYQKAFFDGLNVISSDIAKREGISGIEAKNRSAEIMSDAARIQPKTPVGALARQYAQEQAARVTSTNTTPLSKLALGIKDAINKAVPKLGDAIIPIAKIPANVIWNGIENSGVGIPLGFKDIWQGRSKIQSDNLSTRYEGMAQMSKGIQTVARTIGVMSAAALFASQLTPHNFKKDQYGNSFVKIGNVWINMEYISAISPALAGFMKIKQQGKSGQSSLDSLGQYVSGSASSLKSAPGIDEAEKLVSSLSNEKWEKGIEKYASDFFSSRGVPVFISNLLKNRPIDRLFFGAHGAETTQQVEQDKASLKKKEAHKQPLSHFKQ